MDNEKYYCGLTGKYKLKLSRHRIQGDNEYVVV